MSRNVFGRLTDWEIAHRRWVFLALAVVTVAAGWLVSTQLRFDFRPEALLDWSAEEEAFARAFRDEFHLEDNVLLVVLSGTRPGAVLDARGLTLLYHLTEAAAENAIAARVVSLPRLPRRDAAAGLLAFGLGRLPRLIESLPITADDAARVRRQVETSRLIPGQLVSEDGSTTAVVVVLEAAYADHSRLDRPLAELERRLRDLVQEEQTAADASDPAQYDVHFAGLPFVRVETVRNLKREQRTFWPLTALLYLSLLAYLYRDPWLTVVPLVAVGLASLWGLALLPLTRTEVNVVNNIAPSLILVIGVCNAIHMLHAFCAARRAGTDAPDAARQMMEELGLPAFLTTFTTAVGFASLTVARNATLQQLGWQAAGGVMLSYAALIFLFPPVLSLLGARSGRRAAQRSVELPWLERTVAALSRRPRLGLGVALAVFAAGLLAGSRVPVDATMIDTFPPGHPIYESNRLVEEKLGGTLPLEIELRGPRPGVLTEPAALRQLFAIQQAVAREPGVLGVSSVVDLIAEVHGVVDDADVPAVLNAPQIDFALRTLERYQPGALSQYLNADRTRLRIAARLRDHGIRATLGVLDDLEAQRTAWLAPFGDGVELRFTGQAHIAARGLDFFIRDLIFSLLTASAVIFLVLIVVFRSLRIGLLSVLPTLLPLTLTLGLMPLYGYQLNTSTTIVFTITIGMAVDNTIHLLTRFRTLRRAGVPLADAVRLTYRQAGAAVVASNLLLIAGFSILFVSDFEPVFRVAVLTTTTIAAALLAALFVLPELLTLFGRPIGEPGR